MSIGERDQPLVPPSNPSFSSLSADGSEQQEQQQLCPYPADPTFDELGYKVILYLKRCFRGRILGATEPLSETETSKVCMYVCGDLSGEGG